MAGRKVLSYCITANLTTNKSNKLCIWAGNHPRPLLYICREQKKSATTSARTSFCCRGVGDQRKQRQAQSQWIWGLEGDHSSSQYHNMHASFIATVQVSLKKQQMVFTPSFRFLLIVVASSCCCYAAMQTSATNVLRAALVLLCFIFCLTILTTIK